MICNPPDQEGTIYKSNEIMNIWITIILCSYRTLLSTNIVVISGKNGIETDCRNKTFISIISLQGHIFDSTDILCMSKSLYNHARAWFWIINDYWSLHSITAVSSSIFTFTETPLHSLVNVYVLASNIHSPSGDPGAFNRSGYQLSGALDSSKGWPEMVLFAPRPGTKSLMAYPHV